MKKQMEDMVLDDLIKNVEGYEFEKNVKPLLTITIAAPGAPEMEEGEEGDELDQLLKGKPKKEA